MEAVVRPQIPMYCLQGAAYVCALGAAAAVDGCVGWPFAVVDKTGAPLATVEAHGGYDDEGLFIRVTGEGLTDEMVAGIRDRISAWQDEISRRQGAVAGPLAPLLEDYGNIAARGTFCGVDVWGRATVRTASGRELEVAPEQASLHLVG